MTAPAIRRAVVLGASGFVGSTLATRLRSSGIPVVAPGRADLELQDPSASGALAALLAEGDALVVCAALTPDRGRDARTMIANLVMADHVCAALGATKLARVLYLSSDAVYADGPEQVAEASCASPSTYHGLMHLARERMFAQATPAGTPLLILRPCAVFGAGDTHGSYGPNRFIRTALAEGTITLFGEGEDRRNHLYVEDLAALMELALTKGTTGVMNVAGGGALPFREVAELVAGAIPGEVSITGRLRAAPLSHRQVDDSLARRSHPEWTTRPIREAIALSVARVRERADPPTI